MFLFQTTLIYSISHWGLTEKGEFPNLGSIFGQDLALAQKRNISVQPELPGLETVQGKYSEAQSLNYIPRLW